MDSIKKNNAIEGLRGWLIISIVLFHYTARYPFYANNGFCWESGFTLGKIIGVSGFFLLSGYLMFKSLIRNIAPPGIYSVKKIKRLCIPFQIALIFLFICNAIIPFLNHPRIVDFISNFFLIRVFVRCPLVDGAHWYFFTLLQLYVIVPSIFIGYKQNIKWLVLLSACLMAFLVLSNTMSANKSYLFCFFSGFFLAFHNKKIALPLYFFCGIIASILLRNISVLFVFGIIPLLIFDCGFMMQMKSVITWTIGNRLMVLIGKYSYMWYLIHQQLGYSIINLLKNYMNDYFVILVTMVFTFSLSILLHKSASLISSK